MGCTMLNPAEDTMRGDRLCLGKEPLSQSLLIIKVCDEIARYSWTPYNGINGDDCFLM